MDILIILFFLTFVISFDQKLLKKLNAPVFEKYFRREASRWVLLFFLTALLLAIEKFYKPWPGHVAAWMFLVIFVIYLWRRNRFDVETLKATSVEEYSSETEKQSAMSDCLGLILKWIFFIFIFSSIFKRLSSIVPALKPELIGLMATAIFSSFLFLILILSVTRKPRSSGFLKTVALVKTGRSFFRLFLFPFLIGASAAILSTVLILNRSSQPDTPLSEIIQETSSSYLIVIFIAVATLVAPLIEEIVFRGYFFHVLKKYRGQLFAFYFVALSFAFLHVGQYWGDWQAILMVTLLGLILTGLRVWSGSTISSVVAHYTYNGLVTFIPILFLITANPAYLKYKSFYPELSPAEKEVLLKQSLHSQPEFIEAYNDLAWLYAEENKNLDRALELIDQALLVSPHEEAFLDTKAEVLFKMGRIEEAIAIEESLAETNAEFRAQLEKFQQAQKPAPKKRL